MGECVLSPTQTQHEEPQGDSAAMNMYTGTIAQGERRACRVQEERASPRMQGLESGTAEAITCLESSSAGAPTRSPQKLSGS